VLDRIRDRAEGFELFFASRDLEKARSYSEEFGGAGYFGSYEEAAADGRVEAMYFLTPHHVHLENALLAARHSKHILVEKPIARTIPEARKMVQAARDAGVRLMVAENHRFLPTIDRCKQLIEQGAIGDLRLIQVQAELFAEPAGWRTNVEFMGGGKLIDGGIHFVDDIVNLGGFPESVYAAAPPPLFGEAQAEDGMVITARLPGGRVGLINYSTGTPIEGQTQWINVTGSKGQLSFDPFGSEVTLSTTEGQQTIQLEEGGSGTIGMLREFRSCVLEDREPVMSGEEGIKDLAVVLAAYQSVEQRKEVAISPP
jgi:predicted dehydrogenase